MQSKTLLPPPPKKKKKFEICDIIFFPAPTQRGAALDTRD